MGGGAEDDLQARVVPCLDPAPSRRRHEMASLPIPDELLAEILLRVPTAADLARAHRRLRLLPPHHRPPLLPPPVPEAPLPAPAGLPRAAQSLLPRHCTAPLRIGSHRCRLGRRLSFSFHPVAASHWAVRDIRDGRVVLDRWSSSALAYPEAVVCDPLHRRYGSCSPHSLATWPICSMPRSSLSLPWRRRLQMRVRHHSEPSGWRSAQLGWSPLSSLPTPDNGELFNLGLGLPPSPATTLFCSRQYAYGCFYWLAADTEESKLLVLDIETMEFSIAEPPPEASSCRACSDFAMVEAGEGRPGMFVLAENTCDLSYFIRQNDGGSQWQWQKVKTISLGFCTRLICNLDKYLLLHYRQSSLHEPGCFTLDIETFQLEMVCPLGSTFNKLHAFSNFRPSLLSAPTISSGVEEGPENEMLEQGCATSSSA